MEKKEVAICIPEFKSIIILKCTELLLNFLNINQQHWNEDKENISENSENRQLELKLEGGTESSDCKFNGGVNKNSSTNTTASGTTKNPMERIQQLKQRHRMNSDKASNNNMDRNGSNSRSISSTSHSYVPLKSHCTPEKKKKCPNSNF